jgi:hypothetical protein
MRPSGCENERDYNQTGGEDKSFVVSCDAQSASMSPAITAKSEVDRGQALASGLAFIARFEAV